MSRRIAITGAGGLVGSALCRHLAAAGFAVNALARRPVAAAPGITPFACDLPGTIDPTSLAGCAAVIHAAYHTRGGRSPEARRTNEEGTRALLAAARRAGIERFIFVSSISAQPDAPSYYAQSKLALESELDSARDLAVRPGLVLGHGGLFERMAKTVRRSRFVPVIGSGRQPVQTIHIDDLAEAFISALERQITGRLTVAEPEAITMRSLIRMIGEAVGRRPVTVPMPPGLTLAATRLAERLGIPLSVSSDNLQGLLVIRAVDCRADLERLGLNPRPASQSVRELLCPA
jgi:NADH dehydrogenase